MGYFKLLLESRGDNGMAVQIEGPPGQVCYALRQSMDIDSRMAAAVVSAALGWMSDKNVPISDVQAIAAASGFFTGKQG